MNEPPPISAPPSSASYLDGARLGRTEWWRFVLGLGSIFIVWLFAGSVPLVFFAMLTGAPLDEMGQLEGYPLLSFVGLMLSFVVLFLSIWGAIIVFHGRSLHSLIAPFRRFNGRRALQGFAVWFLLAGLQSLIEALLFPGRYVWTFNWQQFALFLIPVLVLVPIQIAAEELLFRGYLLQWLGLHIRNILALSLLTGILFGLLHMGNPEAVGAGAWLMLINYSSAGFFFAFITIRDNGLELALGVHAANNLFAALVANYVVSSLPTPALFTVQELDAGYGVAVYLVSIILFLLVVFWLPRRPAAPSPQ